MCGIVAMFSTQEQIHESSLKRGMERLHHRGPDGQKSWVSGDGRVGLGHVRLSIVDLAGGDQPIANRDETLRIIVNGEFYDFQRIQRDLRQRGYQLRTQSDSEVALHLYDEFGPECLHHLRGEFALVLWDERNDVLFAARDRFGIKPLYYSVHNGTLYLASEVKALFAAGIPPQWDWESFCLANVEMLTHNRTLFSNVYQVPPGHFLLASDSGIRLEQYWDFNYPKNSDFQPPVSEDEYIQRLRDTLDEAIKLRLRADVPVGCYLSGGLDSSTVLGMAATHAPDPIQAFTLAFEEDAYNEGSIAAETAEFTGSNIQTIPISQSDLVSNFADTIYKCEMLCNNTNTTAKYLLSRAARDAGYKVVLTGEGSDEILGGYAQFRQDMLLHNTKGQDEQSIQSLLDILKEKNKVHSGFFIVDGDVVEPCSKVKQRLGFAPAWMEVSAMWHRRFSSLYSAELLETVPHQDIHQLFLNQIDIDGQLSEREPVHQSMYLWSKSVLPNNVLRILGDGVEMAHSLEGRLPFLDHKVVELICQMPVSLKIRGLTEKYVLREAAKPFITDTVYHRQKHQFLAPHSTLKSDNVFFQFINDTLRSSSMASVPFYNQIAVIQLLDEIADMGEDQRLSVDLALMKMCSACIMQEQFGLA